MNDVAITDGNLAVLQVQDVWPHRDDAGGARAKNSPYEKVQLHQCLLEQTLKRVSILMEGCKGIRIIYLLGSKI